jgi:hypothetical protein
MRNWSLFVPPVVAAVCFALLLFIVGSCAHQPKPYVSPYETRDFSQEEIYQVASYALEALGGDLTGWQIVLIDSYIAIHDKGKGEVTLADGITLEAERQIVVFAYSDCLADSSLIHEIGHAVGYTHAEVLLNLLHKVEEMAIRDLCPPGYVKAEKPDPTLMSEILKGL